MAAIGGCPLMATSPRCEPRGVIFGPAVDAPADSAAALWIAPTLGEFGTVGGLVPQGYESYLLVDHRGEKHHGSEGVCRLYDQLIPVLATHTSTPDRCWFAIWEGHGFDTSMRMLAATPRDDDERREVERERQRLREDDVRRNASIRAVLNTLASFDLPHRRYYLVRGALTAASQIECPPGPFPQPPDLWWPDDRRWFVGGDTDLDWCYIGGSVRLVSAVRAELGGHARPVDWTASNAAVGD